MAGILGIFISFYLFYVNVGGFVENEKVKANLFLSLYICIYLFSEEGSP